ncbi:hypothetical protein ARMGADRAFT_1033073 [Armillaria gallica]|uniref:Uncharacterized protein n=1 Tax=Armillaria gallica TaxID=47427 RepID=A0A2H3DPX4_ARMGA|nr:hypothetical protein ARMGADRAFT_1033073 [Armillaria gallica]
MKLKPLIGVCLISSGNMTRISNFFDDPAPVVCSSYSQKVNNNGWLWGKLNILNVGENSCFVGDPLMLPIDWHSKLLNLGLAFITYSSTAPPSSSIRMAKWYGHFYFHVRGLSAKRHYNLAIEILNLPPEWDKQSYYLKIFAGNVHEKTKTYKVKKKDCGTTSTLRWTLDLDLYGVNIPLESQLIAYPRGTSENLTHLKWKYTAVRTREDILIGKNDGTIVPICGKLSYANASLKIFREGLSNYSPIIQSANEDQDMSAIPQSSPSNTADPESQDTSDLSGLQPEDTSAMLVEDCHATAVMSLQALPSHVDRAIWSHGLTTRRLCITTDYQGTIWIRLYGLEI